MNAPFGSVVTAAATPFDVGGAVDLDVFRQLMDWLANNGSDAVVVAGSTGESPTLTTDEKITLFEIAVEELSGRIPVIAGTGSYDTAATIELTKHAADIGVDGVLIVTPYYNKPPRAGLLQHFTAVADASKVPIILYNIPGRSVVNLEPDLIAELAQHPKIVALKQAQTDDLSETRKIRELAPDLAIYAGNDDALIDILDLGGVGGICVASHIVGETMADVCRLHGEGLETDARATDSGLRDVYDALAVATNPIPLKAALEMIGKPMGGLRLPLVDATDDERAAIKSVLERHGLTAVVAQ